MNCEYMHKFNNTTLEAVVFCAGLRNFVGGSNISAIEVASKESDPSSSLGAPIQGRHRGLVIICMIDLTQVFP